MTQPTKLAVDPEVIAQLLEVYAAAKRYLAAPTDANRVELRKQIAKTDKMELQ